MKFPVPWSPVRHLSEQLGELPARSHVAARRNALVASSAMAQRRRERIEVDRFMKDYLARRANT